jgi:hypothetical protein
MWRDVVEGGRFANTVPAARCGDILNDRSMIDEEDEDPNDKCLQEAARYLAEAICAHKHLSTKALMRTSCTDPYRISLKPTMNLTRSSFLAFQNVS